MPVLVQHPFDEGLWLGNVEALDDLPEKITAVVSPCLTGSKQVASGVGEVPYRLIDTADREDNHSARVRPYRSGPTVAALRAEGHRVRITGHDHLAEDRLTPTAVAIVDDLGLPPQ